MSNFPDPKAFEGPEDSSILDVKRFQAWVQAGGRQCVGHEDSALFDAVSVTHALPLPRTFHAALSVKDAFKFPLAILPVTTTIHPQHVQFLFQKVSERIVSVFTREQRAIAHAFAISLDRQSSAHDVACTTSYAFA